MHANPGFEPQYALSCSPELLVRALLKMRYDSRIIVSEWLLDVVDSEYEDDFAELTVPEPRTQDSALRSLGR